MSLRRRATQEPVVPALTSLNNVELGDVVRIPDGRALSTRARVELPAPVGSVVGFVICGELEVLLTRPPAPDLPVLVYVPLSYLPANAERARERYSGACRYWAPHLPSAADAMGELTWKVIEVPGSVDPIVITFRSGEPVVWIKATQCSNEELRFLPMPRSEAEGPAVPREGAYVVSPLNAPVSQPEPTRLPAHTTRRR